MKHLKRTMIVGPDSRQAPFLEYDPANARWRVWQAYASDISEGTYLDLYPTGMIDRVTTRAGHVVDIIRITGPVKELSE